MTNLPNTPCREWRGSKTEAGYGRKWHNGRMHGIHRWVAAQILGWNAIQGKVVMHLCDNPPCYRYDHLRVGTQLDNVADRNAKGRQAKGEANGNARLTAQDAREIRSMYRRGETKQWDLAHHFGVGQATISRIVRATNWKES